MEINGLTLQQLAFGVLFALLLLFAIAALLRLRDSRPPYEKRPSLLTKSELKFLGVLRGAADGFDICSMVRIADLIRVRPDTPKRQAWLNRILAKHIDFVLCNPDTMEAVLAIELDDKSHQRADRQARDRFVNDALDAAGLPLLRVPVQPEYDGAALRTSIEKSIK